MGIEDIDIEMITIFQDLADAIQEATEAGATDTAGLIGVKLGKAPEKAIAYARERAAELVGMRLTGTGALVPNPNPEYAITESIRSLVRDKVVAALEQGQSSDELAANLRTIFDPSRAMTIARTETGFAYNDGAHAIYEEQGIEFVDVLDGDGCLPGGHDDKAALPSGRLGVVEMDRQANGQVWTREAMREHPLGHPRCVRAFVPHQGGE